MTEVACRPAEVARPERRRGMPKLPSRQSLSLGARPKTRGPETVGNLVQAPRDVKNRRDQREGVHSAWPDGPAAYARGVWTTGHGR
jgi:hypothetical protein